MRVLTDCPDDGLPLSSEPLQWRDDWTSEEASLWSLFSPVPLLRWGSWDLTGLEHPIQHLLVVKDAPSSQFDTLIAALRQGSIKNQAVAAMALTGKNFHGRYKRPWVAQKGNLHLSVSYPIEADAAACGCGFSILPALAAWSAIQKTLGTAAAVRIKWINDCVIGDQKVAGVLTSTLLQGRQVEQVVFGIGVNLAYKPTIAPTPFVPDTGCLSEWHGNQPLYLMDFLKSLLHELDNLLALLLAQGWKPLLEQYRSASNILGEEVVIWEESEDETQKTYLTSSPLAQGCVQTISPDLSLEIEGLSTPVRQGRLAFKRVCQNMQLPGL